MTLTADYTLDDLLHSPFSAICFPKKSSTASVVASSTVRAQRAFVCVISSNRSFWASVSVVANV